MEKKISSALISVFYKDGLENLVKFLGESGVIIYSTGGTQTFIESLGVECIAVENVTGFPSILGGRVKTLHPSVFGGILGKRDDDQHLKDMASFNIPEIDLVIVDLYPFEETVRSTNDESKIIEKIDIGGPSMLRAAAKNHRDVTVIADKKDYSTLLDLLKEQNGVVTLEQRRAYAIKAFNVCTSYDIAISNYFSGNAFHSPYGKEERHLRYGENPHQKASFAGELSTQFIQLHGKELSYNNLVDADAAIQLIREFDGGKPVFAIIKHTNVCGVARRDDLKEAWDAALSGDPESAFGGVLVCNNEVGEDTARGISEIFFEVLIAPSFSEPALKILKAKKNRIILQLKAGQLAKTQFRSLLGGVLMQENDHGNYTEWNEVGGRTTSNEERKQLEFANIICKHLKSNAIAIVKDMKLVGKGCGQTSRIDALRQAIIKATQFGNLSEGAVLASDAFFPFDDCVRIAHTAGINVFIQPGGSIRDLDSINYCVENKLAMVLTGTRHFRH